MGVIEGSRERLSAGYSQGLYGPFVLDEAPTTDETLLGTATTGTLAIDSQNGVLYICTATNGTSTIAWTKVGTQS